MYKLLLLFCLLLNTTVFASQSSEAFIVKAFSRYYQVLSPVGVKKKTSVIVQNKTLTKLRGKVISKNKGDIAHLSININKSKSVEIEYEKGDTYFFVPLSPPFQSVILKHGEKSYEIPSQRKN